MSVLTNIDIDSRGASSRVHEAGQEWMDQKGYDLDRTSVDQEIEYWHELRGMLNDRGFPIQDLPGRGRLLQTSRIDRLAQLAGKRWRLQNCDSMPYAFAEYVRQGMIWPVETREAHGDTVDRVKQIETYIQSIPDTKRVCKDPLYESGVFYVKTFETSDTQMYLVIKLASSVSSLLISSFETKLYHPTAPYITSGIKFLHNLYQKPTPDGPTTRAGNYNIPGLPTRLHHMNPLNWPQTSVMDIGEDYGSPEVNSITAEHVINNIKQIHDWTEEHVRGTDDLSNFDF